MDQYNQLKKSLKHHSKDFKRRLKLLTGAGFSLQFLTTEKDSLHPTEQMSKEEHARLINNIYYTKSVVKQLAQERWEE